jgi:hypothetical protein
VKECLDAIRSIQLAAMAICAALLVMRLSPILSRQYETKLRFEALDKIPEVPQRSIFGIGTRESGSNIPNDIPEPRLRVWISRDKRAKHHLFRVASS